jgi:hypothetical protein
MKKVFTILFSVIIILSGANLSFAVHYCGGQIAASKISITHTLASCGMATDKKNKNNTVTQMNSNCCVDKVSNLVVDSNYYPTDISLKLSSPSYLLILSLLPEYLHHDFFEANRLIQDFKPPGIFAINSVSLPDICIFRI